MTVLLDILKVLLVVLAIGGGFLLWSLLWEWIWKWTKYEPEDKYDYTER